MRTDTLEKKVLEARLFLLDNMTEAQREEEHAYLLKEIQKLRVKHGIPEPKFKPFLLNDRK